MDRLDLERIAAGTRETGHSTLGLIRELRRVLPKPAGDHVYVAASVQDITDTWTSTAMRAVGESCGVTCADSRSCFWTWPSGIATPRLSVAPTGNRGFRRHSAGKSPHGPMKYDGTSIDCARARRGGWWANSVAESERWMGSTGVGMAVRARFCEDLGLADPGISWFTSRDRIAEFSFVLTAIAGTLARIGVEVYELQRPEIGELTEARATSVVGSITMAHKRNPEGSEHLDTLSRLDSRQPRSPRRVDGRCSRAGRPILEGRVGCAARGVPVDRDRRCHSPFPWWRDSKYTPTPWPRTLSTRSAGRRILPTAAPQPSMVDLVVEHGRESRRREQPTWP